MPRGRVPVSLLKVNIYFTNNFIMFYLNIVEKMAQGKPLTHFQVVYYDSLHLI